MISDKIKRDSIKYIKESKNFIYASAISFLIFIIIGFLFSSHFGFIDNLLERIINEVSNLKGTDIALYIFANNVQSAIIGMTLGVFFGIVPILNLIVNGLVTGYVLARVTEAGSILEIWKLFPHGIFELPAIFIALGLGIKLGMSVFMKNPLKVLKERLYFSAAVFLSIILPLLALAAIIEGLLIAIAD